MSLVTAPALEKVSVPSTREILEKAGNRAFNGGKAGFLAATVQVLSFMWMRTIMNYQYRHGTAMKDTAKLLFREGGVRRFYRGLGPALLQAPLARFGDTAANAGALALLNSYDETRHLPTSAKTALASTCGALWRACLMPIDALKTTLQVSGPKAIGQLGAKVHTHGFAVLFHGTGATMSTSWIGYYPWFYTFNKLNELIPEYEGIAKTLGRNAGIGCCASICSDSVSNTLRVLKTAKQTNAEAVTYPTVAREIIAKEGILGLMGRGLGTRLLCNCSQGMIFSVGYKYMYKRFTGEN